ncbi:hypothetical protein CPT03_11105 [Pedobacter ginsengisoli]|uniref:Uncharacterized protein n=1 Tax=Pedobacter ginsengisoli TaxID=363852 RepID=A0A2D1U5X6_9SPHI|nr:hypothetical protein CPT03_11105 [Pedobacter ginsengisoli]
METTSISQITTIAKECTRYSFIAGSLLFLIYCLTKFSPLIGVGLLYIVLALVINSIIFLSLLITIIIYPEDYLPLLKTAIVMLFNLPIAFIYLWIITELPLI